MPAGNARAAFEAKPDAKTDAPYTARRLGPHSIKRGVA